MNLYKKCHGGANNNEGFQHIFTILDQPLLEGRGGNPIVIWNWVWFGTMWMNNTLGVMQMKWQIQEEEWHELICQSQMCPHFQNVFILWASWIPEVQELLAGTGLFWGSQGRWEIELTLKFGESRKRFNSSNTNLDKPTNSGTLH